MAPWVFLRITPNRTIFAPAAPAQSTILWERHQASALHCASQRRARYFVVCTRDCVRNLLHSRPAGVKHALVVCCLRLCTTGWNEVAAGASDVRESSIPMAMVRKRLKFFFVGTWEGVQADVTVRPHLLHVLNVGSSKGNAHTLSTCMSAELVLQLQVGASRHLVDALAGGHDGRVGPATFGSGKPGRRSGGTTRRRSRDEVTGR